MRAQETIRFSSFTTKSLTTHARREKGDGTTHTPQSYKVKDYSSKKRGMSLITDPCHLRIAIL
jgi:hypothetical protein